MDLFDQYQKNNISQWDTYLVKKLKGALTLKIQGIYPKIYTGLICLMICWIFSYPLKAQSPSQNTLECPSKDGVVRYALKSNRSTDKGISLFFYKGSQYMQGAFKEDTYVDIHTDGEVRIKGTFYSQNADFTREEWIADLRFYYKSNKILAAEHTTTTPEIHRIYQISAESKLINKNNRQELMAVRPLIQADQEEETNHLTLHLQQTNASRNTSLISAFGSFEYQRPDGSWRQGKLDILLEQVCRQINPLKFESIPSDQEGMLKWRLENNNQREVRLSFRDFEGQTKSLLVSSIKKGGVSEFYTDIRGGGMLILAYETVPDQEVIRVQNKLIGNFHQEAQSINPENILPKE